MSEALNQETLDFLQILYGLMLDNFTKIRIRHGNQKVEKLMKALDRQIQLMASNPSLREEDNIDPKKTTRFLDLGD